MDTITNNGRDWVRLNDVCDIASILTPARNSLSKERKESL